MKSSREIIKDAAANSWATERSTTRPSAIDCFSMRLLLSLYDSSRSDLVQYFSPASLSSIISFWPANSFILCSAEIDYVGFSFWLSVYILVFSISLPEALQQKKAFAFVHHDICSFSCISNPVLSSSFNSSLVGWVC